MDCAERYRTASRKLPRSTPTAGCCRLQRMMAQECWRRRRGVRGRGRTGWRAARATGRPPAGRQPIERRLKQGTLAFCVRPPWIPNGLTRDALSGPLFPEKRRTVAHAPVSHHAPAGCDMHHAGGQAVGWGWCVMATTGALAGDGVPIYRMGERHPQALACSACEVRSAALFGVLDEAGLDHIHMHIDSLAFGADETLYDRCTTTIAGAGRASRMRIVRSVSHVSGNSPHCTGSLASRLLCAGVMWRLKILFPCGSISVQMLL